MSYSIDANLLVYASDSSSGWHERASSFLREREQDPDLFCITWPVVMAYLRIATHPSVFSNPLTPDEANENIEALLGLPRVMPIGEREDFFEDYRATSADLVVRGNLVPDAHLAAILRQNGVRTLYTHDADFLKFEFLDVRFPLR